MLAQSKVARLTVGVKHPNPNPNPNPNLSPNLNPNPNPTVMEAVLDKLKLLGYEGTFLKQHRLPPLPRFYFCGAQGAQASGAVRLDSTRLDSIRLDSIRLD